MEPKLKLKEDVEPEKVVESETKKEKKGKKGNTTESSSSDSSLDRKTLFVRSLPGEATSEELSEFFSEYVPVKHAIVVKDKDQKSRGFGFVSFPTDDDALTALEKAQTAKFKGKLLRIEVAKRRERKIKEDGGDNVEKIKESLAERNEANIMQKTAKLIVRNLPWSVREPNELVKLFEKYGKVKEAHIPRKKDGKMSGFAFVTMAHHTAALKAVKESSNMKIGGRVVAVDLAIDKSNWEKHEEIEEKAEDAQDSDYEETKDEDEDEDDDDEEDDDEDGDEDDDDEDEDDEHDDADLNFDALDQPKQKKNWQEKYSVFIRNLPYNVTQEGLEEHFKRLGDIKYALPVMDKQTGLAKGTAFVAFEKNQPYEECLLNAPAVPKDSVLLPDDVSPFYVYDGRVMQIAPAVDRDSASRLTERHAESRRELLGREPRERDKRKLFLLNEGRVAPGSKLADLLSPTDMQIRERSYDLRVKQLNNNPTLHLSMTRLAIRNIPRAMNEKALKALGRKAVVEFATEVKAEKRHSLNKEELDRSTKHTLWVEEKMGITEEDKKQGKNKNKHGIVTQAKIINEVKGSGEYGRSRGYGFLEYRDHRCALMALRWLNAHEVTPEEIVESLTDEQKKIAEKEKLIKKKRLVVEFAIENASVIKRRLEQVVKSRSAAKRRREEGADDGEEKKIRRVEGGRSGRDRGERGRGGRGGRGRGGRFGERGRGGRFGDRGRDNFRGRGGFRGRGRGGFRGRGRGRGGYRGGQNHSRI